MVHCDFEVLVDRTRRDEYSDFFFFFGVTRVFQRQLVGFIQERNSSKSTSRLGSMMLSLLLSQIRSTASGVNFDKALIK